MKEELKTELPLEPYRVLDLTEGYCQVCGKILGDLGADVIKVEPPQGSPTRKIGPFYRDIPHPEKGLAWFAYNNNKRGITLNIESADGKQIFRQLVKTAHFVIETFDAGFMATLGLGFQELSQINPGIILVSITPYGQTGPKSKYKACDLTTWASGGLMYITGAPDRPPVWISFPQSGLNAGAEAAGGALIAHWYRVKTGEGQHIDVSIQASLPQLLQSVVPLWDLARQIYRRSGDKLISGRGVARRLYWMCRDGYITQLITGGALVFVRHSKTIVEWMAEEGMAPEWLKNFDWVGAYDANKVDQGTVNKVEEPIANFFKTKTKTECFQEALKRRLQIAPVYTTEDLRKDPQLEARKFWQEVEHPELGEKLVYVGPFIRMSRTPITIRRRAPLIGEHNLEVYHREMGFSLERLMVLKQGGII